MVRRSGRCQPTADGPPDNGLLVWVGDWGVQTTIVVCICAHEVCSADSLLVWNGDIYE